MVYITLRLQYDTRPALDGPRLLDDTVELLEDKVEVLFTTHVAICTWPQAFLKLNRELRKSSLLPHCGVHQAKPSPHTMPRINIPTVGFAYCLQMLTCVNQRLQRLFSHLAGKLHAKLSPDGATARQCLRAAPRRGWSYETSAASYRTATAKVIMP